jgi:HEPN domain-containing protein
VSGPSTPLEVEISRWLVSAEASKQDAYLLLQHKRYPYSLFTLHLAVEKLLKAEWMLMNREFFPPKTHILLFILKGIDIDLSNRYLDFCNSITQWCINGRYPSEKRHEAFETSEENVKFYFKMAESLWKDLLRNPYTNA